MNDALHSKSSVQSTKYRGTTVLMPRPSGPHIRASLYSCVTPPSWLRQPRHSFTRDKHYHYNGGMSEQRLWYEVLDNSLLWIYRLEPPWSSLVVPITLSLGPTVLIEDPWVIFKPKYSFLVTFEAWLIYTPYSVIAWGSSRSGPQSQCQSQWGLLESQKKAYLPCALFVQHIQYLCAYFLFISRFHRPPHYLP